MKLRWGPLNDSVVKTAFTRLARDYLLVLAISLLTYIVSPSWGPTAMVFGLHISYFALGIALISTYWLACGFLLRRDVNSNLAATATLFIAYICLAFLLAYPFFIMDGYNDFKTSSFAGFCKFAGVSLEYPDGVFDGRSDCAYLLEDIFNYLAVGVVAAFVASLVARLIADRNVGQSPR